jgi:hypothetical protein
MRDYWLEIFWSIWAFLFSSPERTTATFTAVLGLSTIGLWLSTRKLWRVTRIAAEHIQHVERAYVSGGAPWTDDSLTELCLTINNYGKTPAFVGTVIIGMIEAGTPVPEKPVYAGKGEFAGAVVKPDVTLRSFLITRPCVPDGRVVYGRIYYRDIFNIQRVCVESLVRNARCASARCLLGRSRRSRSWARGAPGESRIRPVSAQESTRFRSSARSAFLARRVASRSCYNGACRSPSMMPRCDLRHTRRPACTRALVATARPTARFAPRPPTRQGRTEARSTG